MHPLYWHDFLFFFFFFLVCIHFSLSASFSITLFIHSSLYFSYFISFLSLFSCNFAYVYAFFCLICLCVCSVYEKMWVVCVCVCARVCVEVYRQAFCRLIVTLCLKPIMAKFTMCLTRVIEMTVGNYVGISRFLPPLVSHCSLFFYAKFMSCQRESILIHVSKTSFKLD